MKVCKIGICEDDERYREMLVHMIRKNIRSGERIYVYFFPTGGSLLNSSERWNLDILFMDVELPDGNGNFFVELFRRDNIKAIVSFCTNVGYPEADTFKLDIYRYIRKDEGERQIEKQVVEIFEEYRRRRTNLNFRNGKGEMFLNVSDILYFEKCKNGTQVYLSDGQQTHVDEHLNDIFQWIDESGFARPHESYIVNMEYITGINRKRLTLSDGRELTIACRKWKQFQEDFRTYIEY